MRLVQYRILTRILNKIEIPDYIYAFEKDRSIPSMARKHVGKKVVISLDIKNFFPTIKQHQLLSTFQSLGIGQAAALTLSEVCTVKAYVPQGALTSPKLSNVVAANTFGPVLNEYCRSIGADLTIYADDITVSFNGGTPPEAVVAMVETTLSSFGFRVNSAKTKIMFRKTRQYVCGVVVNEKTNLIRNERLALRAIVHNIEKNGFEAEAKKNNVGIGEFISHVRGRLNWFKQLNPSKGQKLIGKFVDLLIPLKNAEVQTVSTASQVKDSKVESLNLV
jgi:RNA-directed DNA polymerase